MSFFFSFSTTEFFHPFYLSEAACTDRLTSVMLVISTGWEDDSVPTPAKWSVRSPARVCRTRNRSFNTVFQAIAPKQIHKNRKRMTN